MATDGSRPSLRLGDIPRKEAEAFKINLEKIVDAQKHGVAIDSQTQVWINSLNDECAAKLSKLKLIETRASAKLITFIDSYIAFRQGVEPGTTKNYHASKKALVDFFGANRALRTITSGDCHAWKQSLVNGPGAEATYCKYIKHAKQFFNHALRNGLIDSNPFQDLKAGSQVNKEREFFVTRGVIEHVLKFAPTHDWKLIILLCRYGGMRCPSEVMLLRWSDIDWEKNRIFVRSPKGKKHGKGIRETPLFPELYLALYEGYLMKSADNDFVVQKFRGDNKVNVGPVFTKILKKAGVKPWPRIMQNMRSTRETELLDLGHPLHLVTAWLGNTPRVATMHYLQVTDHHFQKATEETEKLKLAVQNPAYSGPLLGGTESQEQKPEPQEMRVLAENNVSYCPMPSVQMPPVGLEPTTR